MSIWYEVMGTNQLMVIGWLGTDRFVIDNEDWRFKWSSPVFSYKYAREKLAV